MSMHQRSNKVFILFSILMLFAINSHAGEAGSITFSFAPPDGTTYIQKLTTTREKQTGSAAAQHDESVSTTRISIKKTPEGWDIIAKPETAVMKRNGAVVHGPMIAILSEITVVYKLGHDGVLKDLEGYEEVEKAIKSQFPPGFAKKIAPLLNSDVLKKREMAEWTGRVDFFLGKTVVPGDEWEYEAPFSLPNGLSVNYNVKTRFGDLQPCGNARCIKIEQEFKSDDASLPDAAHQLIKSAAEESGKSATTIKKTGSSIKGRVMRLIEPATMLIHEEVVERTIHMKIQTPGGATPVKITRKRNYTYKY